MAPPLLPILRDGAPVVSAPPRSTGAYAPDKALAWPDRLASIRMGGQPYPVHAHLILSDLCSLSCPGCFPAGTPILTADGWEPIEQLEEGQRVFGHDGALHAITKTMTHAHAGELIRIRPRRLGSAFVATPNHPVLARRGGQVEWRALEELRVGDDIALRVPEVPEVREIRFSALLDGITVEAGRARVKGGKTTSPDRIPLNAAFGEVLGLYLGDGSASRHMNRPGSYQVGFYLGAHENDIAERLCANLRELFDIEARTAPAGHSETVIKVTAGSSLLGRLLLTLCRGGTDGSHAKQFHPALFGGSADFLEGLLRGYAWADGCLDDRSLSTVSRALGLDAFYLALRLGLSPTLFEANPRDSVIDGRPIIAHGSRYTIRFRGTDRNVYDRIVGVDAVHPPSRSWRPIERTADGNAWLPIATIERIPFTGQVYNVEVEDAHSYIADGVVAHNCAYRLEGYSSAKLFAEVDEHGFRNPNPNRMLPTAQVESLLRTFKAIGTQGVECTGGGEPTLHPDFDRLYGLGLDLELDMALITHGLLLGRQPGRIEQVARSTWARISIDAATAETYGRVRPSLGAPRGSNLFVALRNLLALRAKRDELKTACVIGAGFVVQRENYRELYDAVRLFREHGADNVRISGLFTPERDAYFHGWRAEAEELERRAVADFDDRDGFRVYGRFREKVADLVAAPDYKPCDYQQITTYVAGDGNVYRCCVTAYNPTGLIGKLSDFGGDFRALWDSHAKRARFANFDASRSCTHCQFNDRNRAIRAAIEAPELPTLDVPPMHKSFV